MNAQRALVLALEKAGEALAAADRALAAAIAAEREAGKRFEMLARYRGDYGRRKPAAGSAVDLALLQNTRAFLGKLDLAVGAQQSERDRLARAATEVREARQAAHRRHASLEKLMARRAAEAAQRAARQDQKLTDQAAARCARRATG